LLRDTADRDRVIIYALVSKMGRSNKEKEEARRQNSKKEGNKMSSRVVEELNASGFVTAGAYKAVLQKVVMETENKGKEMRRPASSRSALSASSSILSLSFFSASKRGSINFLEDDDSSDGDGEEGKISSRPLMDKLNASFSSFYTSSMRSLGDELGESPVLSEKCHINKERNIAPKRTSIEHKGAINGSRKNPIKN
jgi:hypothetical protein